MLSGCGSNNNGQGSVTSESSISAGEKTVQSSGCLNCHAINGSGGTVGPSLSTIGSTLSSEGITAAVDYMVSAGYASLSAADVSNVASYLSSLTGAPPSIDSSNGETVMQSAGCFGCHSGGGSLGVSGGITIGPSLSTIGSTLSSKGISIAVNYMVSDMVSSSVSSQLTPSDISTVDNYLSSLTGAPPSINSSNGETAMQSAGCLGCHTLNGTGGIGPDLSTIGSTLNSLGIRIGVGDMVANVMSSGLSSDLSSDESAIESYLGGLQGTPLYESAASPAAMAQQTCLLCHSMSGFNGVTGSSIPYSVAPDFSAMTPIAPAIAGNMAKFFTAFPSGSQITEIMNQINAVIPPLPSGSPEGLADMQSSGCFACHTITANGVAYGPGATNPSYYEMFTGNIDSSGEITGANTNKGFVAPDLTNIGSYLSSSTGIVLAVNVMTSPSPGGIADMLYSVPSSSQASSIESYLSALTGGGTPAIDFTGGGTIFYTAGCLGCHTVSGEPAAGFSTPGGVGPDLSTVGSTLSSSAINNYGVPEMVTSVMSSGVSADLSSAETSIEAYLEGLTASKPLYASAPTTTAGGNEISVPMVQETCLLCHYVNGYNGAEGASPWAVEQYDVSGTSSIPSKMVNFFTTSSSALTAQQEAVIVNTLTAPSSSGGLGGL